MDRKGRGRRGYHDHLRVRSRKRATRLGHHHARAGEPRCDQRARRLLEAIHHDQVEHAARHRDPLLREVTKHEVAGERERAFVEPVAASLLGPWRADLHAFRQREARGHRQVRGALGGAPQKQLGSDQQRVLAGIRQHERIIFERSGLHIDLERDAAVGGETVVPDLALLARQWAQRLGAVLEDDARLAHQVRTLGHAAHQQRRGSAVEAQPHGQRLEGRIQADRVMQRARRGTVRAVRSRAARAGRTGASVRLLARGLRLGCGGPFVRRPRLGQHSATRGTPRWLPPARSRKRSSPPTATDSRHHAAFSATRARCRSR